MDQVRELAQCGRERHGYRGGGGLESLMVISGQVAYPLLNFSFLTGICHC